MNYLLKNSSNTKFKEKRSEFIAYSETFNCVDDLNIFLKGLKSKYPTARHFCWAYRIVNNGNLVENSSDAGEPSGSAGMPILNVLKSKNIVNCGIVVIRYFGGIKLGKQGLIKAYKTAAELVIAKSDIVKWEPISIFQISADIKYYGAITHCMQQFNGKIKSDNSSELLRILIELQDTNISNFKELFFEVTKNTGKILMQSEHDQTKEVRK